MELDYSVSYKTLASVRFLTVGELHDAAAFIRCGTHLNAPREDLVSTLTKTIVAPRFEDMRKHFLAPTPQAIANHIYDALCVDMGGDM